MKTILTIQESAELIKRGVGTNKASGTYVGRWEHSSEGPFADPDSVEPLFTLADLLSLLPKKIDDTYRLKIQSCDWPTWTVCYTDFQSGAKGWHQSMELIDALYKLLLWSIDNNHVKLD